MLFMLGYLAVTGRWGDIRQVFADKKTMICCMVSGVLVCVNWGVYIFAINSGMYWMPVWDIFWNLFL